MSKIMAAIVGQYSSAKRICVECPEWPVKDEKTGKVGPSKIYFRSRMTVAEMESLQPALAKRPLSLSRVHSELFALLAED